ncbi:MAG: serine/threonine protein kinase [Proteobacteria bacterium]|nr:serine/threonine protein kinase [Pseudomonadota bacterium]
MQPSAANAIRTKHSRYELLERVGSGHLSEVFKARATGVAGFAKIVAIKRLLPTVARDPDCVALFNEEARIGAALSHANIAQVFECGADDGLPFLAMEYLDGRDLASILAETRRRAQQLPLPVVLYIVEAVCRGLAFAHARTDAAGRAQPVLHEGLSARSIFISHEGAVKLLAFGAAAARRRSPRGAELRPQAPLCPSPEQLRATEVDVRTDLFAVGAVLYEALTGRPPFSGDTAEQICAAVLAGQFTPPRALRPELSEELEAIVVKALAASAGERWQSADELEHALVRYAHQARVTSSIKQIGVWMRATQRPLTPQQLADTDRRELGVDARPLASALDDEPTPMPTPMPTPTLAGGFERAASAPLRHTLRGYAPTAPAGARRDEGARDDVTHDEPTTIRLADDDSSLERALEDMTPTPVDSVLQRYLAHPSLPISDATVVVPEEDMVAQFGLVPEPVADPWADGPTVIDSGRAPAREAEDLPTPVQTEVAESLARRTGPVAVAEAIAAAAAAAAAVPAANTPVPEGAAGDPTGAPIDRGGVSSPAGSAAPLAAPVPRAAAERARGRGVPTGRSVVPSTRRAATTRPLSRPALEAGVGRWVLLGALLGIALVLLVVAAVFWRTRARRSLGARAVIQRTSRPDWRPEVVVLPEDSPQRPRRDASAAGPAEAPRPRPAPRATPSRNRRALRPAATRPPSRPGP